MNNIAKEAKKKLEFEYDVELEINPLLAKPDARTGNQYTDDVILTIFFTLECFQFSIY